MPHDYREFAVHPRLINGTNLSSHPPTPPRGTKLKYHNSHSHLLQETPNVLEDNYPKYPQASEPPIGSPPHLPAISKAPHTADAWQKLAITENPGPTEPHEATYH